MQLHSKTPRNIVCDDARYHSHRPKHFSEATCPFGTSCAPAWTLLHITSTDHPDGHLCKGMSIEILCKYLSNVTRKSNRKCNSLTLIVKLKALGPSHNQQDAKIWYKSTERKGLLNPLSRGASVTNYRWQQIRQIIVKSSFVSIYEYMI